MGKGVRAVVDKVNTVVTTELLGQNPFRQDAIDNLLIALDGTANKSVFSSKGVGCSQLLVLSAALQLPVPQCTPAGVHLRPFHYSVRFSWCKWHFGCVYGCGPGRSSSQRDSVIRVHLRVAQQSRHAGLCAEVLYMVVCFCPTAQHSVFYPRARRA